MAQRDLFEHQNKTVAQVLSEQLAAERPSRVAQQFITPAHLEAAKNWPDAIEALQWVWDAEATVREMQAWHRIREAEAS